MRGLLNVDRAFFPARNAYGFPELDPVSEVVEYVEWLPFPERSKASLYGSSGIHFFCEDFTFESVWNQPTKYIHPVSYSDNLKLFKYVIQPDFSLYYNFPVAVQIFNKYRNHWIAKYFAFHGVTIIPNINVSTPECWDWSFLGYPQHSVVAWSDIGSYRDKSDRAILMASYEEMLKRLEPLQVLYFTRNSENVPSECVPIVINYRK